VIILKITGLSEHVVSQTLNFIGSRGQYSRIMEFITSSHGGVKLINDGFAYTKKA